MSLDSINAEQRLYVIPAGKDSYSCLGFDIADKWARQVAQWLKRPELIPVAPIGTADHFAQYEAAMDAGRAHNAKTRERCPAQLVPELVGLEGKRVEVTLPDGSKSRFYVGKSTGWLPIHLEIKTRRSTGGGAVYFPQGARVHVVS